MSAGQEKAGKDVVKVMEYTHHYASTLGGITMASDGESLIGLWFDGQKNFLAGLSGAYEETSLMIFNDTVRWLDLYFSGRVPDFTPRLSLRGSAFRKAVWDILRRIPYGERMAYGEIAARLSEKRGSPTSARAVGGAVGHNPISLIIPCHRVVGSDGSLTGYAGGVHRKKYLLVMEDFALGKI